MPKVIVTAQVHDPVGGGFPDARRPVPDLHPRVCSKSCSKRVEEAVKTRSCRTKASFRINGVGYNAGTLNQQVEGSIASALTKPIFTAVANNGIKLALRTPVSVSATIPPRAAEQQRTLCTATGRRRFSGSRP